MKTYSHSLNHNDTECAARVPSFVARSMVEVPQLHADHQVMALVLLQPFSGVETSSNISIPQHSAQSKEAKGGVEFLLLPLYEKLIHIRKTRSPIAPTPNLTGRFWRAITVPGGERKAHVTTVRALATGCSSLPSWHFANSPSPGSLSLSLSLSVHICVNIHSLFPNSVHAYEVYNL